MSFVLEAVDLHKRYGRVVALSGATLRVRRGVVTALVGPNGAGKTTLIESVLGLRALDSGFVMIFGEEVRGFLPRHIARRIGTVLEGYRLMDTLTVEENVRFAAELMGVRVSTRDVLEALDLVGARELAHRLYGKLSTGQRKKAEIAAAIVHKPEFIILDEPEAGLDPLARVELMENIVSLVKQGITVMYSTHDLSLAARYSNEVAVIARGKVLAQGDPLELAVKFGGAWRVVARLSSGEVVTKEVGDVRSMGKVIEELGDVREVRVEPPSLEEAFRRLVAQ